MMLGIAFGYIMMLHLGRGDIQIPDPPFVPFRLSRSRLEDHEKQNLRDLAQRLSKSGEHEYIRIPK